MYERPYHDLLPFRLFVRRVAKHLLYALIGVAIALGIGMFGYHFIAGFSWIDSILNAAMILTGMGPVGELKTISAKLFASGYALFSGLVFITLSSLLLAPVAHRFLHKFHLAEEDAEDKD